MNLNLFFDTAATEFSHVFTTPQRKGCDLIIRTFYEKFTPSDTENAKAAYVLATAYHETAATMQPIAEFGGNKYLTDMYDVKGNNPKRAILMGNTEPGDGIKYCGRGFVQLTWKNNYARAGKFLGKDLVNNPELALDPEIAAGILVEGMAEGWFTGRTLNYYFSASPPIMDWLNARRIINGTDRAATIATHAQNFYTAIKAAMTT